METEECLVCFDETNQFQLFVCGHKVCVYCYPRLRSTKCPVCSQTIELPTESYCLPRSGCCVMISIIVVIAVYTHLYRPT